MSQPSSIFHLPSSRNGQPLRVAIVHDWLIGGGAEKVVLELHRMFPEAPIYTSYCTDEWRQKLDNKVVTGFLQRQPLPKLRKFVPFLRAWWFSNLDLREYDLVISSSGAEAKGIKKLRDDAVHVCYCHAPTHYYWSRYDEYLENPGFGPLDWLARIGLKLLVGPLRRWDYQAGQRPHHMLANSTYTRMKIKEYYHRSSEVVHPPVDTERFQLPTSNFQLQPRSGYVITGRQTPYKRIDLAVAACTQAGLPLTVIGNGPEHEHLKSIAGSTITFVTNASDEDVVRYLSSAKAFIFPGVDDFGIAPVEALAAGTPVIAYRGGGAMDYVIEGKSGTFFNEQTIDSLMQALTKFSSDIYSAEAIQSVARQFSVDNFHKKMSKTIENALKTKANQLKQ